MDQIPNIVMQCPKCRKRFSFGDTYCEECTAMLEPVEADSHRGNRDDGTPNNGAQSPVVTDEKIEDIRIDTLRVDIENKFVYVLLLEIGQLKDRLAKKERSLAAVKTREGGPDHAEVAVSAGRIEAEVEEIMRKIAKLEITLDNLEQKLQDDVAVLDSDLRKMIKPGLSAFFSERGRYFRMRSSELGTKEMLLDVIRGKRSPSTLRMRSLTRPAVVAPSAAAAAIILALSLYTYFHAVAPAPPPPAARQTEARKEAGIGKREVSALLDDIKRANLTKDAELWRSRYSAAYLASKGKEENIAGKWEKVDFTSLQYRIDKFESGPDSASATITWYIEFRPRKSNRIKLLTQRLRADFAKEDGRLKITSVARQGS
jgi:hypothetical protein